MRLRPHIVIATVLFLQTAHPILFCATTVVDIFEDQLHITRFVHSAVGEIMYIRSLIHYLPLDHPLYGSHQWTFASSLYTSSMKLASVW